MGYPFREIEARWQQFWDEHKTFQTGDNQDRKKIFILDMFPYPSGAGLHVGHPEGYTATDILSRYKRMKGLNVLHPIGWDAFGLPAERYAMQTNIHPRVTTAQNIDNFRRQIKMLGLSYDWSREVNTTDPKYYKWTQWIFLQMYNSWFDPRACKARPIRSLEEEFEAKGTGDLGMDDPFTAEEWRAMTAKERHDVLAQFRLAYIDEVPVNWCEKLGTVLANEEVGEWEEKGYTVERRPMRQWLMRITAYAQRLLEDAASLDWPASTLEQQKNWIGKSEGAWIDFRIEGQEAPLRVFTTRPDTVFGATFLVLAPEHPLVNQITLPENQSKVDEYVALSRKKSDLERDAGAKDGVFTGALARNPATGNPIPVWVADYVLMGYGSGAIMALPAHDSRDFVFAKFAGLEVLEVVAGGDITKEAFEGEGPAVNSSNEEISLDGLETPDATKRIVEWLERKALGKSATQYKLRDWLFSRQRYWGEPIPIIHLEDGTMKVLDEGDLPLMLPELETFQPSGTTESPLALAKEWVNFEDPKTGLKGKRETNTMPQWAGSCWYYLRYLDPENDTQFCAPDKERYWMPIDLYVGGSEHAVLHLIYARFWHKVLFDLGHLSTAEPFTKLRHQGVILGEDSRKMSKSFANVVNPDVVITRYGADSMRLFEMFMGPLEDTKPWSTKGVEGVYRFLNRVWRLFVNEKGEIRDDITKIAPTPGAEFLFHSTVRKVTEDIEELRFNTAISQMMIFVNEMMKEEKKPRSVLEPFVLLLSPFAPHLGEELWHRLGHSTSLAYEPWPAFDESKLARETVEVVLQINGKVRSKIEVNIDTSEKELEVLCRADESIKRHVNGKSVVKVIVVKNRLVNLVVR